VCKEKLDINIRLMRIRESLGDLAKVRGWSQVPWIRKAHDLLSEIGEETESQMIQAGESTSQNLIPPS